MQNVFLKITHNLVFTTFTLLLQKYIKSCQRVIYFHNSVMYLKKNYKVFLQRWRFVKLIANSFVHISLRNAAKNNVLY